MGKYFCSKCKFFDDDVSFILFNQSYHSFLITWIFCTDEIQNWLLFQLSKKQYHCDECGICRYQLQKKKVLWFFFGNWLLISNLNDVGIDRTGGEENFFHCKRCRKRTTKTLLCALFPQMLVSTSYFLGTGCCYSKVMEDKHRCVEGAMHHNCPVCFEVKKESYQSNFRNQCKT